VPLFIGALPQPTDRNVEAYIREYTANGVRNLVRSCDPSYNTERVRAAGIDVHEMAYPDGDPPPDSVIDSWLALCDSVFKDGNKDAQAITVHCVAGLGRAPVLVAIAMIEAGCEPADAIDLIRKKRSAAFNRKQTGFLTSEYQRRKTGGCCTVM
jgi:protein tyrosine phosphatase type 4A